MALLGSLQGSRRRKTCIGLSFTALALLGGSCMVLEEFGWGPKEGGFSHALHVGQEELTCEDCHLDWEDSDQPGMPSAKDECLPCHEDEDTGKLQAPVAAFFVGGEYDKARLERFADEVIFSHRGHATDEDSCQDCHSELVESESVRPWMRPGMQTCVECHEERGADESCAACHSEIRQNELPRTHDGSWAKAHGRAVRDLSDLTVDKCALCHQESTCVACHQDTPPDSHTNFWRLRGHGVLASLDRQNCAACHREDYCIRCHQTVEPISHTGNWGGTRSNHCLGCHIGGGAEEGCGLCHMGTPSHALAPPRPPGHDSDPDCRSCHIFLRHADNGSSCTSCHM